MSSPSLAPGASVTHIMGQEVYCFPPDDVVSSNARMPLEYTALRMRDAMERIIAIPAVRSSTEVEIQNSILEIRILLASMPRYVRPIL